MKQTIFGLALLCLAASSLLAQAEIYGQNSWVTATPYPVGAFVVNGGQLYECNTAHNAGATFAGELVDWTLVSAESVNSQAGTSYTVVTTDVNKVVVFNNASAVAVTLPQATTTGFTTFFADFLNLGAGTVTITPTTSTVNGVATFTLANGQSARLVSDGTNYFALPGKGSASTGGVDAQTGTSYTIPSTDSGKLVTFRNAGTVAVTLPQATGTFAAFTANIANLGAGPAVITPTTSTINGSATYTLNQGQSVILYSDGTNYQIATGINPISTVNAQSGITYTIAASDNGKLITFTNASAQAVTLPQATTAGFYPWTTTVSNTGAGVVTITPTVSTINGAATLVLQPGQSAQITSDGVNFATFTGSASNVNQTQQVISQAAHGFTVGEALCLSGGVYAAASQTCANAVGVVSVVPNANQFTLTTFGLVSGLSGLTPGAQYYLPTGGLTSGTYTSGITATGSTGQTCTLTTFNNGNFGGQATVALTGTNAIAGGTALVILASGSGNTSASTSATATSGSATCSGTATITTVVQPAGTLVSLPPSSGVLEQVATATSASTEIVGPFTNQAVTSQYGQWQSNSSVSNNGIPLSITSSVAMGTLAPSVQRLAFDNSQLPNSTTSGNIQWGVNTATVKSTGNYSINFAAFAGITGAIGTNLWAQIVRNGTTVLAANGILPPGSGDQVSWPVVWTGLLNSGDTIDIRFGGNSTQVALYGGNLTIAQVSGFSPVTGQTIDYLNARLTANQTGIAGAADITGFVTQSGNITNGSGVFALKAGETYDLEASVAFQETSGGSTTSSVTYAWVDAAGNTLLDASGGGSAFATFPGGSTVTTSPQTVAHLIYTPSVNQTVKVRVTTVAGGTTFAALAGTTALGSTYAIIKQLGTSAATAYSIAQSATIAGTGAPFNVTATTSGTAQNVNTFTIPSAGTWLISYTIPLSTTNNCVGNAALFSGPTSTTIGSAGGGTVVPLSTYTQAFGLNTNTYQAYGNMSYTTTLTTTSATTYAVETWDTGVGLIGYPAFSSVTYVQIGAPAASTFTAATSSTPGTAGFVAAPPSGSQNQVLTGGAAFVSNVPLFTAGTSYSIGDVVIDPFTKSTIRALVAHTAAGTYALDAPGTNWTNVNAALESVDAQVGTSYTVPAIDNGKLLTLNNTAAVAVSLPQATTAGFSNFFIDVANVGTGTVTITPTTSTINGAATYTLTAGQSVRIVSDATNYQVAPGKGSNSESVNAQTGATYTIVTGDNGKLVTFSNAGSIAVTVPSAATAGFSPFVVDLLNTGGTTVTLTPAAGNIAGQSAYALSSNQSVRLVSDGTNWQVFAGKTQEPVNAQTGTTYTVVAGDSGKALTFTNAAAIAVTLPQTTATNAFYNFFADFSNIGSTVVTITPTTSTIGGATSYALQPSNSIRVVADGAGNYQVLPGATANPPALTQTITQAANGFTLGQVVCNNGTTYVAANTSTCANGLGVVSTTGTNSFGLTTQGLVTGLSGLTQGSQYYVPTGGLVSGTYTSGITATGSTGQTCNLTSFNNGNTGGSAYVALTGTNTIAGGTALTIVNSGYGNTANSSSATASSGTATCSGTATVATTTQLAGTPVTTVAAAGTLQAVYTAQSATTANVNPFVNQAAGAASGSVTIASTTFSSASFVNIAGTSFTLPSAGTYRVTVNVTCQNTTVASYGAMQIATSGGTAVPGSLVICQPQNTTDYITTSQSTIVTATGATSYVLQGYTFSGSTLSLKSDATTSSTITWDKISGFLPVTGTLANYYSAGVATQINTPAAASVVPFTQLFSASGITQAAGVFTIPANGTYQLHASLGISGASSGGYYTYQWYTGGSAIGSLGLVATPVGNSNTMYAPATAVVTTGGSAQTVQLQVVTPNGTVNIIPYNSPSNGGSSMSITQLGAPATTQFIGATSAASGTSGYVPAPITGQQNQVLTGASTFASNVPIYENAKNYNVGDVVVDNSVTPNALYRCITAHLSSGATLPADVIADWQIVGSSPLSGSVVFSGNVIAQGCAAEVTTTVTGATTSMAVVATPDVNPGNFLFWLARVSAANTVAVKLCNPTTGSIGATSATYNIRVIQ